MPLFTVTMKSNGSTKEKDRLSRAIHAASIAAGYPEDDLFQRFLSLGPSDFRVDLYYPALPKPRTDQMLMIEVLVSSGTDTNRKKGLVAALVEKPSLRWHGPLVQTARQSFSISAGWTIRVYLQSKLWARDGRLRFIQTTCHEFSKHSGKL
jgi:hypothetical protein